MSSLPQQRLRLVLITSGCDGTDVGEAWSSFQWVTRLAERHDVTLLTYRRRDKTSAKNQITNARVMEWLDLPILGKWDRFNSMLKPGYISFYVQARSWLKRQLREGERIDLVHQLTPLALRYPSPAAGLGIPLVLGPMGGSLDSPECFETELAKAPWYTKLRELDAWRLRHDPILRRSFASASQIVCVAPYVRTLLNDLPSREPEYVSETGVAQLPPATSSRAVRPAGIRLLFVGRVIRTKGVRDAIRAVAKIEKEPPIVFDVVGDGYDLAACKAEAEKLGVGEFVRFHGRVPRQQVDSFYAEADIFLFPSFREPSGNAVIEAMSHGLALVVADRGGPGFVVDDNCGIRVPVETPEQFASGLAQAIRRLSSDRALVAQMGAAARDKVRRQFLWNSKVERMEQIYGRVLAASPS